MVCLSIRVGFMFMALHPLLIFIPPVLALVAMAVGVGLLHAATSIVGVETASFNRAFTCAMMNAVLGFILGLLFTALSSALVFSTISSSMSGDSFNPAAMQSMGSLSLLINILNFIANFMVSVFCVHTIYHTSFGKAAAAVVLNYIIGVVTAALLFFIILIPLFGGLFL